MESKKNMEPIIKKQKKCFGCGIPLKKEEQNTQTLETNEIVILCDGCDTDFESWNKTNPAGAWKKNMTTTITLTSDVGFDQLEHAIDNRMQYLHDLSKNISVDFPAQIRDEINNLEDFKDQIRNQIIK